MRPSRLMLLSSLLACCPVTASENVAIVLDASGSMWGQIAGRAKIEIAREAVGGIVADWNPDDHIALVAYGHNRKGDCADIQALIPLGPLDADRFMTQVRALHPKGMTPLSQAVIDAAQALKSSEQKATVVLISDGEETCHLDPCAVGAELETSGVDFTAHVIGFDVQNPAHQAQLRCLAENTGGRYFNARDAHELGAAMQGAVSASTAPAPLPASATLVPQGTAHIVQPLAIDWSGPADKGDFITVTSPEAPDGHYLTYAYVPEGEGNGRVSVDMPASAGQYELRYVSPRREKSVLARLPLIVGDAQARIEAPATASAGSEIDIVAEGPVASSHWIGFVHAGADTGAYIGNHYARPVGPRSELRLRVPAEAGDYELRYVLNESERVIASRPITVIAAEAAVSGPVEVMAGDRVTIQAQGPSGSSHWIGFAPAGSDPGAYVGGGYGRPQGPNSTLTVTAPAEPGDYEYRYVLFESDRIAASQPVKVTPARIALKAEATYPAATHIQVGFSGPRGNGHWIGFVPAGGDGSEYHGWSYVPESGDTVSFHTPETPGDWDLVFHLGGEVVARTRVRIVAGP